MHGLTNKCSVSTDFEISRHESTLEYLGKYFDNATSGVSIERYLEMCEVMGDTPDPEKMPPDYGDFPAYVHIGIEIFNALPDMYSGGTTPIYTGKDLASLTMLFELYLVEVSMRMKTFEIIRFLDNRARTQAIKAAEKANKRSK